MVALVGIGGMLNGDTQDWPELSSGGEITGRAKITIWPPRNEQRHQPFSQYGQTSRDNSMHTHARTYTSRLTTTFSVLGTDRSERFFFQRKVSFACIRLTSTSEWYIRARILSANSEDADQSEISFREVLYSLSFRI